MHTLIWYRHMSNWLHILMASLLFPEYVPCLLSSFLHLLNAVLAASPLATLQQKQLPILASLNAHRLADKHTHRHTDRHIHYYIYTLWNGASDNIPKFGENKIGLGTTASKLWPCQFVFSLLFSFFGVKLNKQSWFTESNSLFSSDINIVRVWRFILNDYLQMC